MCRGWWMSPTRCTKNAIGEGSFMAQFGEGKKNGYVTEVRTDPKTTRARKQLGICTRHSLQYENLTFFVLKIDV